MENTEKRPGHFYLVTLLVLLMTGEKMHTMRGLGLQEPLKYTDLVAAAKREHGDNVDTVIILHKESLTLEEYKHFWKEEEDREDKQEK